MSLLLPSCYRFYNFKTANIKPFGIEHLTKLASVLANNNLNLMFNTFNEVFSDKVGVLTLPDFEYMVFYQWFNTFNKPYMFSWTSKYGNEVVSEVNLNEFKITKLELENFELLPSYLTLPRTEEMLLIKDEIKPEVKWIYDRVQFIKGDRLSDKIKAFNAQDVKVLADIKDFMLKTEHGITKTVQRTDTLFDSEKYLKVLYEDRNRLNFHSSKTDDYSMFTRIADGLYTVEQEIKNIEMFTGRLSVGIEAIEAPKVYPEVEIVSVDIDLSSYID